MRKFLFPAALSAIAIPSVAFGDGGEEPLWVEQVCVGCGSKPAAKPPACNNGVDDDGDQKVDWRDDPGCTDASDNDETDKPSGPVLPPAPEPPAPPAPPPPDEYEVVIRHFGPPVRLGVAISALGYGAPLPSDVVDHRTHSMLSDGDLLFSGYGGIGVGQSGYVELNATFGHGQTASQYLGAGILLGGSLNEDLILGAVVMGGVRDYAITDQQYVARRVGGLVGPKLLWELDSNENAMDVRLGAALLGGYSKTRQVISNEILEGMEIGAALELQFGGQHNE